MIITMFTSSTVNWIMCIVSTFTMIDVWQSLFDAVPRKLPSWLPIVNAAFQPINVSVHYKSRSHIIIREHPRIDP